MVLTHIKKTIQNLLFTADEDPRKRSGRIGRATVAVLTITDDEFGAAKRILGVDQCIEDSPCFTSALSPQHQYDLILRQAADRSNTPANEAVGQLIEDFRPAFVILMGTAGGVSTRENTAVGDIILGDYMEYTEYGKLENGCYKLRRMAYDHPSLYLRMNMAFAVKLGSEWTRYIDVPRPTNGSPKVIVGHIAAGEKILSDCNNNYQKEVMDLFEKALAFEMEGFGVARQVFEARKSVHYNVQYLAVRAISDLIDQPLANDQRKLWTPYAACAAAAFTRAVSERILAIQR